MITIGVASALQEAVKAQSVPNGSYRDSCNRITVNNDSLSANCRRINGGYTPMTLTAYSMCQGDIRNLDGQLNCQKVSAPR